MLLMKIKDSWGMNICKINTGFLLWVKLHIFPIFQAYVNHTPNVIWLPGFPDKPETLPHAGDNYDELHESDN